MMNFPFGTNGKLLFLGVPILKHIRVTHVQSCCVYTIKYVKSSLTFKIKFQTDETKCSELMLTWLHSKESES